MTPTPTEVTIKEARFRMLERGIPVSERTLHRWAALAWIRARRLAAGHGPWLVELDEKGWPIDGRARNDDEE